MNPALSPSRVVARSSSIEVVLCPFPRAGLYSSALFASFPVFILCEWAPVVSILSPRRKEKAGKKLIGWDLPSGADAKAS